MVDRKIACFALLPMIDCNLSHFVPPFRNNKLPQFTIGKKMHFNPGFHSAPACLFSITPFLSANILSNLRTSTFLFEITREFRDHPVLHAGRGAREGGTRDEKRIAQGYSSLSL
jgi:hypothetical protein